LCKKVRQRKKFCLGGKQKGTPHRTSAALHGPRETRDFHHWGGKQERGGIKGSTKGPCLQEANARRIKGAAQLYKGKPKNPLKKGGNWVLIAHPQTALKKKFIFFLLGRNWQDHYRGRKRKRKGERAIQKTNKGQKENCEREIVPFTKFPF